jgi:hypothetical protein
MPPPGCTNESLPLGLTDHISGNSLHHYGAIIFRHVFVGRYTQLRQWCLVPDGRFEDRKSLNELCSQFIKGNRHLHSLQECRSLANLAFCAYLEWMTRTKFTYSMWQAPPVAYSEAMSWEAGEAPNPLAEESYRIFYFPSRPTGNCTYVNSSLMYLLQFLGIHPKSLSLTSIGTSPGSNAYVITRHDSQLREMLTAGEINNEYAPLLKLPAYISKTLKLKPGTCDVTSSALETPFPNHQYARVDFAGTWQWYDARCGLRYSNPMGIFEFWTVREKISYLTATGQRRLARVVRAPEGNHYSVEAPEVCWPGIQKLTKKPVDPGDANAIAWFYVEGDTSYGPADTPVRLEAGGTLMLPRALAAIYGCFISDADVAGLPERVKKALKSYEGRLFTSLRKPSPESRAAVQQLHLIVGGATTDETKRAKYYDTGPVPFAVANLELRDVVYGLLRTAEVPGVQPLKRDSSLFVALADAVSMPKFLR